jgi:cytochrome c-type biogenesis protein CcsB
MTRWLDGLASLKLTVGLLLGLCVVLAVGTIRESMHGAEAARALYYSPAFFALQAVFALNVIAALATRWPRNRWRVGFALTHLSMVLILGGALVSWIYKVEGQIPLWEGDTTSEILQQQASGQLARYPLPFQLRLDSFEIDTYQGTRRPAMFRSRVTVLDPRVGKELPAIIQMNQPLAHGGFHFFQSSYQISGGREMSILSVSRDPGQTPVFIGYTLLVAGMIVVFATRLVQHRRASAPAAAPRQRLSAPARKVAAALVLGAAVAAAAPAAQVPDAAVVESLRALPVQHDGRTMPFDTQAREALWSVTGLRAWPGLDPVAMAAGWAFDVGGWVEQPIVQIGSADLAQAIGLAADVRWASYRTLAANVTLRQLVDVAYGRQRAEEKLGPLDKKALALYERLHLLDAAFSGDWIRVVPAADPNAAWTTVRVADPEELVALGARLRAEGPPAHYPTEAAIARELRYNQWRPTRLAWLLMLPSAIAAIWTHSRDRFRLRLVADAGLVLGFAAMTWGLALRWQIAERIPASNMYESMLFLAWGVGLFGLVALVLRQRLLIANAAAVGAVAMMLTDLLPMDGFIHPVAPVLAGTVWLAIHVPIIVVAYSVLAMATALAHLVLGLQIFAPQRRDLSERFSQMLYWYLHVGNILLIAGILTGSIWAASSWGRYWGWDPKEVWSLIAFLAYMAILHARFDAQIRAFGVAAWSILAFWTILMTYLGVNYVLAAGLHSYGFGSSNLVSVMLVIAAVEAAFVLTAWNANRRAAVALA